MTYSLMFGLDLILEAEVGWSLYKKGGFTKKEKQKRIEI